MVKMVKNGQKWSKWSKHGGLDLQRARRTGLSARRAQRTMSKGPKGLQFEVGAWRAPRLLVKSYSKCELFAKCVCHQMLLLLLLLLLHLCTEEEGRSGDEE